MIKLHRNCTVIGISFLFILSIIFINLPGRVDAKTFTDDLGRKVEITGKPERIVSLAPNITEILFDLNLGDRIVGVTDFCDYPTEARTKPSVGWLISPNIEKIISLQPDMVFATAEGNRLDTVETLERMNIKVYVLNPHSIEDVLQEIITIGNITGQNDIAKEKVHLLNRRIDAVKKHAEGEIKMRALYLVSLGPVISVGPGSFIHDVLTIAGGVNVLSGSPVRYPRVEMEEIILHDPEVIIAPPDLIDSIHGWKKRWGEISAIKHDRIYSINPDIISRPGPRIVDGLEKIFGYIHEKSNIKSQNAK